MFLFDPLREHRWHSLTVGGAMGLAIAGLAPKLLGSSAGLAGQLRRAGAGEPAGFFLHALIARSWLLLFAVQAMLVATGRPAMQRRLGVAATGVAVVMLVTGCSTMMKNGRAGTTAAGTRTLGSQAGGGLADGRAGIVPGSVRRWTLAPPATGGAQASPGRGADRRLYARRGRALGGSPLVGCSRAETRVRGLAGGLKFEGYR